MKKIHIEKDSYYDSVFLMLVNKQTKEMPGITDAVVSMGTPMNMEILQSLGFAVENVTANDLILAVDAIDNAVAERAVEATRELITNKKRADSSGDGYKPITLGGAVDNLPDANLVVVSVPGEFAAAEVRKALEQGLHVMLFSDNVSLEDEIELKKLARSRGLLMMGPDCGTAIINGKPLCFANVVRHGDIGLVGASGTGLQEVTCSIDELGGGVSQAIGTGGRDLKNERVGGMMMLTGIEALQDDEQTSVIVVISKPPAESVADTVIEALRKTGKPCVIHFIGLAPRSQEGNLHYAGNLEEAAGIAVALASGETYHPRVFSLSDAEISEIVRRETSGMAETQRYLRGLFTGGTLADEALLILDGPLGGVHAFDSKNPDLVLKEPHISQAHTIVDLGEDVFTVGRPHPMIDPSTREERINREAEDPEVCLLFLDIVLGYGSHEDPAGAIIESLKRARERAAQRGGYLSIITSITGTSSDFQGLEKTRAVLEDAGCVVMSSNFQAASLALHIMEKRGGVA